MLNNAQPTRLIAPHNSVIRPETVEARNGNQYSVQTTFNGRRVKPSQSEDAGESVGRLIGTSENLSFVASQPKRHELTLTCIRHARATHNEAYEAAKPSECADVLSDENFRDAVLTDDGRHACAQWRLLDDIMLRDFQSDNTLITCSPLRRAIETTYLLFKNTNVTEPFLVIDGLKEQLTCFPCDQSVGYQELMQWMSENQFDKRFHFYTVQEPTYFGVLPDQTETTEQLQQRVRSTLQSIISIAANQQRTNIILVTHGHWIHSLISSIFTQYSEQASRVKNNLSVITIKTNTEDWVKESEPMEVDQSQ